MLDTNIQLYNKIYRQLLSLQAKHVNIYIGTDAKIALELITKLANLISKRVLSEDNYIGG